MWTIRNPSRFRLFSGQGYSVVSSFLSSFSRSSSSNPLPVLSVDSGCTQESVHVQPFFPLRKKKFSFSFFPMMQFSIQFGVNFWASAEHFNGISVKFITSYFRTFFRNLLTGSHRGARLVYSVEDGGGGRMLMPQSAPPTPTLRALPARKCFLNFRLI